MQNYVLNFIGSIGYEIHFIPSSDSQITTILFRRGMDIIDSFSVHSIEFNDYDFWNDVQEKVKTLLYHKIAFAKETFISKQEFIDFILLKYPKLTPTEKLDRLLLELFNKTKYEGQKMT